MNKQEAIDTIKNIDTLNINDMIAGQNVDMVIKNQVLDIINQINEPQKVVMPKYIADKIEYCKNAEGYGLFHAMDYCYGYKDSADWLEDNQELFARAWLDGYEIEQEKLYTVEIPNPNNIGNEVHILMMNGFKQVVIKKEFGDGWKKEKGFQLTESEIKKDFDWAWQFREEVRKRGDYNG